MLGRLLRDPVCLVASVFLISIIAGAVGADFLSPFDPVEQNLRARNLAPTFVSIGTDQFPHVLGTDQNGRDVLSRLLHGGRVSLTVGLFSVLISGTIGVLLGLLAGYYRGRVDTIVMSLVNLQMGFPMLLLALTVLYAVGPGFINLVLVLAVSRWMEYARITRGMMLSLREVPFVEAARAIGCRDSRIIFVHLLPNLASPVLILTTLEVATGVLGEASLSFLGLGIQPPQSSWGLMLAQGRSYMSTAWWLTVFPGLSILFTVLSLNLLVTWLRAATDPAQKARLAKAR
ncbi:MAG: ABC transporter permease [Anaerolineae bacterium]